MPSTGDKRARQARERRRRDAEAQQAIETERDQLRERVRELEERVRELEMAHGETASLARDPRDRARVARTPARSETETKTETSTPPNPPPGDSGSRADERVAHLDGDGVDQEVVAAQVDRDIPRSARPPALEAEGERLRPELDDAPRPDQTRPTTRGAGPARAAATPTPRTAPAPPPPRRVSLLDRGTPP